MTGISSAEITSFDNNLTLYHVGGGESPQGPPLDVISCHSVRDAPTNSKFIEFSQLHLYFHLVKSFFTFFCNFYKKITIKIFFQPKKQRFFDENGQNHFFLTNIDIFCFKIVISILCFEKFFRCITCL